MRRVYWLTVPVFAWIAGCGQAPQETHASASAAAVAVQTATAAAEQWPASYEAVGTVKARTSASLSAKVMGYVKEVRVQTGDRVQQGQLLIVLDARDAETGVRRAEAARDEVKSAIPEADSGIAAAKAGADLAQATFRRMEDLYQKKSISNQEYDEASARLKSAQAAYEMARAKRAQLDAKLAQAEQEVQSAAVNRSYSEIAAPFSGVVTGKSVDPGNLAAPGTPLLTVEREGSYRLEAQVDESRLRTVRAGESVPVTLEGLGQTVQGRVSEIVPAVDPASRAGTVKIDLPALAGLRSGVFGRAAFAAGSRKVIAIPAASVVQRGQLQSVFAVEAGVAHTRLVTLGERRGDRVEVLSGLNEGEAVIHPAAASLADGTRVEVRP